MLQVKLEKPTKENSCQVKLTNGMFAIVDKPLTNQIAGLKWRAIKWHFRWYAVASRTLHGSTVQVAMHRLIAATPRGEVCHHYNKNSLDNRFANLLNQLPLHHQQLHKIRKFGRKNDNKR